jgi:hypothetical protein
MFASFIPLLAHLSLLALVGIRRALRRALYAGHSVAIQARQSRPEDGGSERDSGREPAGDSRQSEALRHVTERHPELGPKQNKGHVFTALFRVYARERLSVARE